MAEVDVSVEVAAAAPEPEPEPAPAAAAVEEAEVGLDDFFSKKDKKKKKEKKKKGKKKAAEAAESSTNPVVTFVTSAGQFSVELFITRTPITVSNFLDLVNRGFYNGICFHRIILDFMIQGGCPNTKNDATFTKALAGKGNAAPNSTYTNLLTQEKLTRNAEGCIDDEYISKDSNELFTLAMANTGARDSGGSQFFINAAHNRPLDWFESDLSPSKHTGKSVYGTAGVSNYRLSAIEWWFPYVCIVFTLRACVCGRGQCLAR
jgi:cyclophilin family peptidyl-prolyl cis-trans isomerase